jgi:hypothetical protein
MHEMLSGLMRAHKLGISGLGNDLGNIWGRMLSKAQSISIWVSRHRPVRPALQLIYNHINNPTYSSVNSSSLNLNNNHNIALSYENCM